jgi:hypothetical protein
VGRLRFLLVLCTRTPNFAFDVMAKCNGSRSVSLTDAAILHSPNDGIFAQNSIRHRAYCNNLSSANSSPQFKVATSQFGSTLATPKSLPSTFARSSAVLYDAESNVYRMPQYLFSNRYGLLKPMEATGRYLKCRQLLSISNETIYDAEIFDAQPHVNRRQMGSDLSFIRFCHVPRPLCCNVRDPSVCLRFYEKRRSALRASER